jgi:hypothetical protein
MTQAAVQGFPVQVAGFRVAAHSPERRAEELSSRQHVLVGVAEPVPPLPTQTACQIMASAGIRQCAPLVPDEDRPSTAEMLVKLRRVLIAAKYQPSHPDQPTPEEIHAIRLAWEHTAAYSESRESRNSAN